VLWFDGGWEHSAADHHAERWCLIRHLQPAIVITTASLPQDFLDPRADDPGDRPPRSRLGDLHDENDTWGFKASDTN